MLINEPGDLQRLLHLDSQVVRDSVSLVRQVTPGDLGRPTPCSEWTPAGLLAHMTAQHRGFAAAALGDGEDPVHWRVRPPAEDFATEYGQAAERAVAAFATVAAPDRPFALPELSGARTFPAALAIGFHLVDYTVHTWDVAHSLGLAYDPGPEVLDVALPLARAVPDGDVRRAPDSPFRPALPPAGGASPLEQILAYLGRSPGRPAATSAAAGDTAC